MTEPVPESAPDLTVVVPAHDEAESLPSTLEELRSVCGPRGWPIVVVDDGSADGTAAVARAAGAVVLRHKVRRGYGGALKAGIAAATTPWVVSVDADGQHDPGELPALLAVAVDADATSWSGRGGAREEGPTEPWAGGRSAPSRASSCPTRSKT